MANLEEIIAAKAAAIPSGKTSIRQTGKLSLRCRTAALS